MENNLDCLSIKGMNSEQNLIPLRQMMILPAPKESVLLSHFFDQNLGVEGHRDENHQWHGRILFYDTGNKMKLYKVAEFRHGTLHGDTKHFTHALLNTGDPNGVLQPTAHLESVFRYSEGTLIYTELYEGGVLRELSYENGVNGGLYRKFYSNGKIMEQGHLIDGVPQGAYVTFEENGKVMSKAHFKNGEKDGSEQLFKNGELIKEIAWKEGIKHGREVEYGKARLTYDPNDFDSDNNRGKNIRTERTFQNGVMSGPYLEIVDGFALVKGNYSNDQRNDIWEYFGENHKLIRTETFLNDVLHGPIMFALTPKEIVVGVMNMGRREGQFDHINLKSHKPISSDVYRNGEARLFILYDRSGLPNEIGQVKNSQKSGLAIRFAKDGSRSQVVYRAGVEENEPRMSGHSTEVLGEIEGLYENAIKL